MHGRSYCGGEKKYRLFRTCNPRLVYAILHRGSPCAGHTSQGKSFMEQRRLGGEKDVENFRVIVVMYVLMRGSVIYTARWEKKQVGPRLSRANAVV